MASRVDRRFRPRKWEQQLDELFLGRRAGRRAIIVGGGPSVSLTELAAAVCASERVDLITTNAAVVCDGGRVLWPKTAASIMLDDSMLMAALPVLVSGSREFPVFVGNTLYDNDHVMELLQALRVYRIPSNHTEGLGLSFGEFSNGGNSGFAAIQLAVLLGYRDIGLVGFDGADDEAQDLNFHDMYEGRSQAEVAHTRKMLGRWVEDLVRMKPVFDGIGVAIRVLSRPNPLVDYPCVDLHSFMEEPLAAVASDNVPVFWPVGHPPGEFGYYREANACFGGAVNHALADRYRPSPAGRLGTEKRVAEVCWEEVRGGAEMQGIARVAAEHLAVERFEVFEWGSDGWRGTLNVDDELGSSVVAVVDAREAPVVRVAGLVGVLRQRCRGVGDDAHIALMYEEGHIQGAAELSRISEMCALEDVCVVRSGGSDMVVGSIERCVSELVRVFVGSEKGMETAEAVLKKSVEWNSSLPIEWRIMSDAREAMWRSWDRGRVAKPGGWATGFSLFRWAVPELCDFKGRAIYLDADMLCLGDIAELWRMPLADAAAIKDPGETSVMVMNCEQFMGKGWPTVAQLMSGEVDGARMRALLESLGWAPLNPHWNCLDGVGFVRDVTRLLHFTDRRTQPWRPFPERFVYEAHRAPKVEAIWWDYCKRVFHER